MAVVDQEVEEALVAVVTDRFDSIVETQCFASPDYNSFSRRKALRLYGKNKKQND